MKVLIPWPTKNQTKFIIDGKKNEDVGVIMTYILWDIWFQLNAIEFRHQFWKKLKSLFDRVYKIHVMLLEKELISLVPPSFDKMEDYLVHVKEL